jgi:hypothetical protein
MLDKTKFKASSVEYPELEGTNNLLNEMMIKKVSDEEIEKEAMQYTFDQFQKSVLNYEEYDTYNDFVNGAKWMREQLKLK